ncbi:MAG: hypothetical protein AAB893_01235, partial [Patescibacteria group bacterium]
MNTMEEGLLFEKRDELNHPGVIVLRVADLETIDIPRLDNPSLLEACKFVGISFVLKALPTSKTPLRTEPLSRICSTSSKVKVSRM